MTYDQLTIIQKIALKGFIKHKSLRPSFFNDNDHKYFDSLHMMWIVSNFKEAINHFLNL